MSKKVLVSCDSPFGEQQDCRGTVEEGGRLAKEFRSIELEGSTRHVCDRCAKRVDKFFENGYVDGDELVCQLNYAGSPDLSEEVLAGTDHFSSTIRALVDDSNRFENYDSDDAAYVVNISDILRLYVFVPAEGSPRVLVYPNGHPVHLEVEDDRECFESLYLDGSIEVEEFDTDEQEGYGYLVDSGGADHPHSDEEEAE